MPCPIFVPTALCLADAKKVHGVTVHQDSGRTAEWQYRLHVCHMFQYNKYTSHQPAKIEPGKRTRIVDGQPSDTIDAPGKARHLSSDPGVVIQQLSAGYAQYNDVPVPLDSDGDGRAVPGDYDGDGRTDTAVWRPSTSVCWVLRTSDGAVVSQRWGLSTDMAISRALQ